MSDNRITLFAMAERGFETLKAIYDAFPDVIDAVVSARDVNVRKDYYEEIRQFCDDRTLPVYDRHAGFEPHTSYALAVSWRWLIKTSAARVIILHDSLLPRYRGFNPLVSALINGDSQVGVTALFAEESYDTGPIIAQCATSISYPITIHQAIGLTTQSYRQISIEIVKAIRNGEGLHALPQREEDATYSLWRDDQDYHVDWTQSAHQISRFVDAVGFPFKGAQVAVNGRSARIMAAEVRADVRIENRSPGKVIFVEAGRPVVVCGTGLLTIVDLVDAEAYTSLLPLQVFRVRFS